jgi:carboxyl-terminal processing protease
MNKIVQFMLKRKVWPIVLVILFAGSFWAFQSQGEDGKSKLSQQQRILTTLGSIIKENHFSPKEINDNFSKEIFKNFLKDIDREKNILLQSDVNALKKYENHIDDEINGSTLQVVPAVNEVFAKRMLEASSYYKDALARPFDFTGRKHCN